MKKKIITIIIILIAIILGIVILLKQGNTNNQNSENIFSSIFSIENEDIPEELTEEILIEENKNFFTFLDTIKNIENLSSARLDGQIKFISTENETYKELATQTITGNFENENLVYKFKGIYSFNFTNLDLEIKFPATVKGLGTSDYSILLEVPTAYKKVFGMTDKETYLRLDKTTKEKMDEVTSLINKKVIQINPDEVENVEEKIQKEKIVNTLNFIENDTDKNTGIYDVCFNKKALLSLYNQITTKEEYKDDLLLKYFAEKILKDEVNIKSINNMKGQIAVSKGVATDIYFEVTSETNSIIAFRVTLYDINDVKVETTEYHSNEIKQFDSFIESLIKESKISDNGSEDRTITIGNIYYTGKDETKKIDVFTKDMLSDPINVFINYSKCTPKTNLVIRWYYENQTIQIIENTLNNGEYEDGILKSSITLKDIDNIPLGKYRVEVYIEGQSKCYGKAEFKIE